MQFITHANTQFPLKPDLMAGVVVFLVALPLCLGIALASGAPLFAGVIAGVVGGTVISLLSGSQVSVSGPAAGLTTIVAANIEGLGSFSAFLAAVVVAGVFQVILGILRAGMIGNYVPNSVIRGMLAAIGIVIILKQIPHALGRDADYEGDFAFAEKAGNTVTDIAAAIMSLHWGAVTIFLAGAALLILWEKGGKKGIGLFRAVPGPLLVVALGIGLNELFRIAAPGLWLKDVEHLVNLPVAASMPDFFRQFSEPDFSVLTRQSAWIAALTIAVVASLETLLSVEAADKIDPYRRISPTSRELRAQGIGNIISGLIGGLPITSVVVRTSANVYAGAQTWRSAFFHGVLLMAAVFLAPGLLNRTPLACLAAILILIGFKLASPDVFCSMYRSGKDQFLPFLLTVLAIIFTDLLIGVVIGMFLGVFFVIRMNHHAAVTVVRQDNDFLMRFNRDMTFVNKTELKRRLRELPGNSSVMIDGSRALFIDHDIGEVLNDFQHSAPYRGIRVQMKHVETKTVDSRKGPNGRLQETAARQ